MPPAHWTGRKESSVAVTVDGDGEAYENDGGDAGHAHGHRLP